MSGRLRDHVRTHRTGMVFDLVFALGWVTLVSLLFEYPFATAPQWAYVMFMLAGVPAYFGFVFSLSAAKETA
ncbi:hypothetical protein [Halorubrum sp. SY-15]|uniref:hypothetical protein n=1 Tax=Halorubrum sp. SY-15 TaxID=3402277 RepID=UPI003EC04F41